MTTSDPLHPVAPDSPQQRGRCVIRSGRRQTRSHFGYAMEATDKDTLGDLPGDVDTI
jgi:hypothetical protein